MRVLYGVWDVYNENREKLDKTIIKSEELNKGKYHISVHEWIINKNDEFLILKRASTKSKFPNMWSMAGGAVLAGETSEQSYKRETQEDLGVELDINKVKSLKRYKGTYDLVDVWLVKKDFDINNVILQEEEVTMLKWTKIDKINKARRVYTECD